MNDAERQQVDLYLDGALADEDARSLLARLQEDPEAVAYLAERSLLHGDLRRSLRRRGLQQWALAETTDKSPRPLRAARRVLVAAAVGVAVGFAATSLVWGVMGAGRDLRSRRLLTEGFEGPELRVSPRFPESSGTWHGDRAEILRRDDAAEGTQVVRFGPAADRRFSYLNRIVDVSGLPACEEGERRELRLAVAVRPGADVPSIRRFTLRLAAFAEDPPEVKELWFSGGGLSEKALSFASRTQDLEARGWTTLEAVLPLPPAARHVVVSIGAGPVRGGTADIAFEADAVTLDLVTRAAGSP